MKGKKLITTICIVCVLATLLCIPAFATVTESDGDGYALYNGEKWPLLPANDFSAFPYAYMISASDLVGYVSVVIYCSDTPAYWYDYNGSSYYGWNGDGSVFRAYEYAPSKPNTSNGFTFIDEETIVEGFNFVLASLSGALGRPIWSNQDIVLPNGTIFLAASDPIPLDGYNVIEWNGDTTGLDVVLGSLYRISDYFMPTSLIVVSSIDSVRVVDIGVDTTDYGDAFAWSSVSSISIPTVAAIAESTDDAVSGVYAMYDTDLSVFTPLIAYRTTETPPDEGGGDDDDPQPPAGG